MAPVKAEEMIPASSIADALTLMAQTLAELRKQPPVDSTDASRIDLLAKGVEALVNAEAQRPHENRFDQGISVFNPLGEVKFPRPDLKCKMYWVGYKLDKVCLTRAEIEALNAAKQGDYRVTKADGRTVPFTITDTQDLAGKLEKRVIHFPCKNIEDRMNHMPMLSYLREAAGDILPNVEFLMAQVETLKAELAARERDAVKVHA